MGIIGIFRLRSFLANDWPVQLLFIHISEPILFSIPLFRIIYNVLFYFFPGFLFNLRFF